MLIRRFLMALLALGVFAGGSLAIALAAWILDLSQDLKRDLQKVPELRADALDSTTEVFDRRGEKIGEFAGERRYFVPIEKIPEHVIQAFLSAEDKGFYGHMGIAPLSIARSAFANLRGGGIRQGASTITQQLVRLTFLDPGRTWTRKLKEATMAIVLERHLKKDEILELYLNKIFLGNRSYGIEAASRNYFRKSVGELSIGEAALLAALPKAPTKLAPNKYPQKADARQDFILARMADDGFITAKDAKAWQKAQVHVAQTPEDHSDKAPYFIAAVQRELMKKFEFDSLPDQGLRIYTTLDARLQLAAGTELKAALARIRKDAIYKYQKKGAIEGAILSLDPRDGAVLAMQGGGDFERSQFNRTEGAKRRIGPLFIPLAVSLALESGHTLNSPVGADPMTGGKAPVQGVPTLYDATLRGESLEAARLYAALGGGSMLAHAKKLGLNFGRDDAMIALGYGEATPADVAAAYGSFLNGGRLTSPYFISRVEDRKGRVLYEARAPEPTTALKTQTAYIMRHLLEDTVRRGVAERTKHVSPHTAGMSGATDDLHNAWFAGGVSGLVSAVWIGAERGEARLAQSEAEAADLAESLWAAFVKAGPAVYLKNAGAGTPPLGLSFVPQPGNPRPLPFLSGTEPKGDRKTF